jgi:uncharacterized protein YyaL (SSP411 family)
VTLVPPDEAAQAHPENRLAHETSPYLLQHARNPVDWYPWGPEALERARSEDKPIFLSIGYSACHWCHVMERECFEDATIAALMNAHFINIKVDREERPDIDELYMKAVVAMTGGGGWPMSVFLTPDQRPFYGATYLPPVRRYNRPSFPDVLRSLSDAYSARRDAVLEQATTLTQHIANEAQADLRGALDADVLERSERALLESFDPSWGGFGRAPKFPHAMDIRLCLRHHARSRNPAALHAAVHTLERMALGGIYDQLGGGFHRYSTDAEWRVPHFEKMLYDNAQLVPAYLEAHLVTGNARFAEVARASCDWALREMQTQEGGFASSQDADSEGEEGKYFAWTVAELHAALGERRARIAAAAWNVTGEGNFIEHGQAPSGRNVLWLPRALDEIASELGVTRAALDAELSAARSELLSARRQRVAPATDDKILASWNGLMISALAHAHQALDEPRYLHAAQRAARYVLSAMRTSDGGLFATARAGKAHVAGCLDDYAFMAQALVDLYESDFDAAWLRAALELARAVQARFWDDERGGYFTAPASETLLARTKNVHDGALPAGGGVQALTLVRLSELTEDAQLWDAAGAALSAHAALANRHPRLFSQLLCAVDFIARAPKQVVIAGDDEDTELQAMLRAVRRTFAPARVVARARYGSADAELIPVLQGRLPASTSEAPRAYVCRDRTCLLPVASASALVAQLADPVQLDGPRDT